MQGSQGLNRFSYVQNNPINATDPTGNYCNGLGHAYAYHQCLLAWNGLGQYARNWHGIETTTTPTATTDPYSVENPWDCGGSYYSNDEPNITGLDDGGGGKPLYEIAPNGGPICDTQTSGNLCVEASYTNQEVTDLANQMIQDAKSENTFGNAIAWVGGATVAAAGFIALAGPEAFPAAIAVGLFGIAVALVGGAIISDTGEKTADASLLVNSEGLPVLKSRLCQIFSGVKLQLLAKQ